MIIVLIACAGAVLWAVFLIGYVILHPIWFDFRPVENVNLSGAEANQLYGKNWPVGVDESAVRLLNQKSESSRDSFSSWERMEISPGAARVWQDYVHRREEQYCCEPYPNDEINDLPEGVRRIIAGPPSLRRQTGETPEWWTPPAIDFRATEVMLWYKGFESGVARATYSGYDPAAETLWIYDYACQHDLMWPHGEVPQGEPIEVKPR